MLRIDAGVLMCQLNVRTLLEVRRLLRRVLYVLGSDVLCVTVLAGAGAAQLLTATSISKPSPNTSPRWSEDLPPIETHPPTHPLTHPPHTLAGAGVAGHQHRGAAGHPHRQHQV